MIRDQNCVKPKLTKTKTMFVESLFFYQIFLTFLSVGFATSYDERTVYTQALLTVISEPEVSGDKQTEISLSGKFGKNGLKKKVSGYLYHTVNDNDLWCGPFSKPPAIVSWPWIALIPRGNCTFIKKITLAKSYNASAVIIYNNVETEENYPMDDVVDMVSVMISKENGETLLQLLPKSARGTNKVKCQILVGTHFVDRRWKVSRTSVLFVLVSFILLMCISLAWLVFYYVQRFRHIYKNDRKEKQLLTAAKKAISKLKSVAYHSANRNEEDESCAVCLDNYKEGEHLRILPCKHEYHKSCIDPWLLNHRTCPMCKSNILKSLGVEIPDNMSLSDHNIEARNEEDRHESEPNVNVTIEEPTTSVVTPGLNTPHAWPEQSTTNARYSSASSISDTDSDRSTAALVSPAQKV